ncbi:DUF6776 family protein [Gayadomonas joobiniege]|uniref:DUF6776 family protein n=1 Tax=Gayadomonas joobiniege TaxID=1234606 RepID=UPI0012DF97E6|nr:DUF6776 family protein [Gayadomonas joobiniege]
MRFYSSLIGVGIAILCFLAGMQVNQIRLTQNENKIAQLETRLQEKQQALIQVEQKLNFVNVENEINQMGVQKIQQQLQALNEDKQNLQAQLTFYERVMAPELTDDRLRVESLVVQAVDNNEYLVRLALVKNPTEQGYVAGHVKMQLKYGEQSINILPEQEGTFNFKYFQIMEQRFQLPETEQPKQLFLQVTVKKGKKFELTKVLDWREGTLIPARSD